MSPQTICARKGEIMNQDRGSKLFTYIVNESTDPDTQGNICEMPSGFSSHDLVRKSIGECSWDIW